MVGLKKEVENTGAAQEFDDAAEEEKLWSVGRGVFLMLDGEVCLWEGEGLRDEWNGRVKEMGKETGQGVGASGAAGCGAPDQNKGGLRTPLTAGSFDWSH